MAGSITNANQGTSILPIDPYLESITGKVLGPAPVILTASPGSGKTTRLPPYLLKKINTDQKTQNKNKKIIVIVPKRLAAVAASHRIAEENNWIVSEEVGYQVRFESMVSSRTQLIFMTEGFFLKKIQDKKILEAIDFLILDEFHERSSLIDLILGIGIEQKLLSNKPQLLVMSATLNTDKLKKYFGDCEHIDIQAPPFPLHIHYSKKNQSLVCDKDFYESLKSTALEAWKKSKKDILIFLPGFREMLKAKDALAPIFPSTVFELIYGSMNLDEQKRILKKDLTLGRRIILSTNIAESSLTLPDLDCVIDCGLEKTVHYEKKLGFSRLELQRISKFSATQRAGRAARTQEGFCFRLWHESDNLSMPDQKKPEILQSSLLDEVLCLYELGIPPEQFSWLDRPDEKNLFEATSQLEKWQLIESKKITSKGEAVSQIPLDIDKSLLFFELCSYDFAQEASQLLAQIESIDFSRMPPADPHSQQDDLDLLLKTPLAEKQKRIFLQLRQIGQNIRLQTEESPEKKHIQKNKKMSISKDLRRALLLIFLKNFPHRLIQKKSSSLGISSSGRGVEFAACSSLSLKNSQADYGLALAGYEKSDAVTVLQSCLGFSKEELLKHIAPLLKTTTEITYNTERSAFQKKDVQKFGNFLFKESATQNLSDVDINTHWMKFVAESPLDFLNLNHSYPRLTEKMLFLKNKTHELQIPDFDLHSLPEKLVDVLTKNISSFTDFKEADLLYYLDTLLPDSVVEFLKQLPHSVKLPSGKTVAINYTDPKAPLISAKIQDCMGWKITPKLLEKIPYTIELLAPNMRPAQTTNNLENFWKTSYLDVRKDLRARYPKHHWPEDPINNPNKI